MRINTIRWFYAIALVVAASPALASFHLWTLSEFFSSADGTVQFIELSTPYSGEEFLAGHTIISSRGATTHSFTFPSDLPGDTAGRTFLIGTAGFAALGLVTPDYIVPNGFLFTTNGSVNYAGVDGVGWAALPVDGTLSIDHNGATAINSPKNFAGFTGSVPALSLPACTLIASPGTIIAGQSSTLTVTCSPAATSYAWTNTGFPATASTGTVSPTVSTTYTVIGSNAAGAGNTASATVSVTTCTYSLSPTSQSVPLTITSGTLSVTSPSSCAWTAISNVEWIAITSGSSGSGNGTVAYSVASNTNGSPRTGTLTIGGQTFTVAQEGMAVPACTLTASASTINLDASVTLTATCSPGATSYAWTPAVGLVPGPANTATVTPTAVGVYQYSVTGSNAGGAGNTASTMVTVAPATFISQSDCLFNWAERTDPNFFAPAGAISNTFAPYYYRYYAQTNSILATSSADSHVYYLGPLSNNSILDVGALSPWLSTAGCQ